VQLDVTKTITFGSINEYVFGPDTFPGVFMDFIAVEIQARRTAGTGVIQVEPSWLQGWQAA
jgi:hypothetical protein